MRKLTEEERIAHRRESRRKYAEAHREELLAKGRERARRRREEQPEHVRDIANKFKEAHKEEEYARQRRYKQAHKAELREKQKEYWKRQKELNTPAWQKDKERRRKYAKRWAEAHPEYRIAWTAKAREEGRLAEYGKAYAARNPEKVRARRASYYVRNKEKENAQARRYAIEHKEQIRENARARREQPAVRARELTQYAIKAVLGKVSKTEPRQSNQLTKLVNINQIKEQDK